LAETGGIEAEVEYNTIIESSGKVVIVAFINRRFAATFRRSTTPADRRLANDAVE
jgi:hypothetical protein